MTKKAFHTFFSPAWMKPQVLGRVQTQLRIRLRDKMGFIPSESNPSMGDYWTSWSGRNLNQAPRMKAHGLICWATKPTVVLLYRNPINWEMEGKEDKIAACWEASFSSFNRKHTFEPCYCIKIGIERCVHARDVGVHAAHNHVPDRYTLLPILFCMCDVVH